MGAHELTIQPGRLNGEVIAPPSKSMMQRICAAIWVRGGRAVIRNPGDSADDRAILALLESAGCRVTIDAAGSLHLDALPAAAHRLTTAHFHESGLAARLCIPILALAGRNVSLKGDGSLSDRPMHFFGEVLPQLGVQITLENGHLPGTISGELQPSSITVDGSLSSQFISGLLMAYAGAGAKDVTITVRNPVSSPYIGLTLDVMAAAGLKVPERQPDGAYYFDNTEAIPVPDKAVEFTVEGDWSAAAFWLVAGAIAGPLTVKGLDVFSAQADKAALGPLMDCGAALSIESAHIAVAPAPLKAFHFNATDCPDLFPPLAVLACYAAGTSVIEGVGRLAHKESDRARTIIAELGKLGAEISLQEDYMIIRGGKPLHSATVSSHNDHRIAMMCAVAALGAAGPMRIEGAGAVSKSYPRFFDDLRMLGGVVLG